VQLTTLHTDSPRGRWTYREWRPPALAGLVELLWESEGTTTEPTDRHFPHGMIELLVNVGGERFDLVTPCSSTFAATWLVGQQLGPTVTIQPTHHHVLGIRLRPAGAFALVKTPLRVLTKLVITLEDVLGAVVCTLVDRCRDAPSAPARFDLVARWLAERFASARRIDPEIAWVADQIDAAAGQIPIAPLRVETGLSKSRLAAAFRDQIGVTPKVYARLVRFRRALSLVEEGRRSLAEVACEAGYYDQPHFNAEFRALTGLSPQALQTALYPSGVKLLRSGG
jgi:AraC-like DNA-binding protein